MLDLITDLKHFEKTHGIDNRFNFFEAVHMVRQETKHSRFLAFLLDPSKPHGLGASFLTQFLSALIANHPSPTLSRLRLAISDIHDARVVCERDHFDITVEIPSLQILLVIENKIDAIESEEQLANYRKKASSKYKHLDFLGCFLTRDGYTGQDEHWGCMSYATIASELRTLLTEQSLAIDVETAIRHYVHLIEKEIIVTDELVQACKQMYAKHKAAFDLVIEHGVESPVTQAFEDFFEQHPRAMALATRTTTAYFQLQAWDTSAWGIQSIKKYGWRFDTPVLLWFDLSKPRKLTLHLEVGPFHDNDQALRQRLIQALRQQFRLDTAAKGRSTTFTRVVKYEATLPDDPAHEDLVHAMQQALDKALHDDVEAKVARAVHSVADAVCTTA